MTEPASAEPPTDTADAPGRKPQRARSCLGRTLSRRAPRRSPIGRRGTVALWKMRRRPDLGLHDHAFTVRADKYPRPALAVSQRTEHKDATRAPCLNIQEPARRLIWFPQWTAQQRRASRDARPVPRLAQARPCPRRLRRLAFQGGIASNQTATIAI